MRKQTNKKTQKNTRKLRGVDMSIILIVMMVLQVLPVSKRIKLPTLNAKAVFVYRLYFNKAVLKNKHIHILAISSIFKQRIC